MTDREAHKPRRESISSAYTLNFYSNGSDSHDTVGGSKYSGISTADRSAGVFGNIGQAFH